MMKHIKRICLSSAVFGLLNFSCFGQWDLVGSNSNLNLWDIHFFDSDRGIAIAQHTSIFESYVLETTNSGQDWDTIAFPNYFFRSMHFPTADTGYIAFFTGFQIGVLRSTDAGENWAVVASNIITGSPLNLPIRFYDGSTGVLSTNGYSWITYDAGVNWTQITTNIHGGAPAAYVKDSIYVGVGSGLFLLTTDTCQSFHVDTLAWNGSATEVIYDTLFYITVAGGQGTSLGYPYFNFGVLAKYDFWNQQLHLIHLPNQRPLYIEKTPKYLYAGGFDSEGQRQLILRSSDKGISWHSQQSSEPGGFSVPWMEKIQCLNDTVCYAYGWGNIYKTTNGGGPLINPINSVAVGVLEQVAAPQINIFPNPTDGGFTLRAESPITLIRIVDISGKLVKEWMPNQKEVFVDLQVESGIYIIDAHTEQGRVQKKIIKL